MEKLVVGVALVSFAPAVAALPVVLPMWEQYRPKPVVPIDRAMRQQVVAALVVIVAQHYVSPDWPRRSKRGCGSPTLPAL